MKYIALPRLAAGILTMLLVTSSSVSAECLSVTQQGEGLLLSGTSPWLRNRFEVQPMDDGSYQIAMTISAIKAVGETTASVRVTPGQYTQLEVEMLGRPDEGPDSTFRPAQIGVFYLPSGDLALDFRLHQGDGSDESNLVSKLSDVAAYQTSCISERDGTFSYTDWANSILNESMPNAPFVDLSELSGPCSTGVLCRGPFIYSPTAYVSRAEGDSQNLGQILQRANQFLSQANLSPTLPRQQAALRGATQVAARAVAATRTRNRRALLEARRAVQTAQRATRRGARAREVGSSINGLRRALTRIL